MGPAGGSFGIVAKGSFLAPTIALVSNTPANTTNVLNVTLVAGRRYRVHYLARATQVAATTFIRLTLRNAGTSIAASQVLASGVVNSYTTLHHHWLLDGDGLAKTLDVTVQSENTTGTIYLDPELSFFYVEDVGLVNPVVTSTQVMSTDVWNIAWGMVVAPALIPSLVRMPR
jgi:hypothetical protein